MDKFKQNKCIIEPEGINLAVDEIIKGYLNNI